MLICAFVNLNSGGLCACIQALWSSVHLEWPYFSQKFTYFYRTQVESLSYLDTFTFTQSVHFVKVVNCSSKAVLVELAKVIDALEKNTLYSAYAQIWGDPLAHIDFDTKGKNIAQIDFDTPSKVKKVAQIARRGGGFFWATLKISGVQFIVNCSF